MYKMKIKHNTYVTGYGWFNAGDFFIVMMKKHIISNKSLKSLLNLTCLYINTLSKERIK